jgi:energy-converting hydrogenase A subunit M
MPVRVTESKVKSIAFNLLSFVLIFGLCGCVVRDTVKFLTPEWPPYDKQISGVYQQIQLKESTSADVLSQIHLPEHELLSQSKSVVASYGQKKKGFKRWLKMVAFDENELTAQRKYLFIEDERPKALFVEPWEGLAFDCEQVLTAEILDEPYADENARRIAILRWMLTSYRKDIDEVIPDNKDLEVCRGLVNQAIETVLVKLDSVPALATRLSDERGLKFEHISFDEGRIRMIIEDDIATVKIRLGSRAKRWKVSIEEIFR